MSERAKLVAKQTINPCAGGNCVNGLVIDPTLGETKIFPEEIDNINVISNDSNTVLAANI